MLELYSNCIRDLTAIIATPTVDITQAKAIADVYPNIHAYFTELSKRRREAENWLFTLIIYGYSEPDRGCINKTFHFAAMAAQA
jgi:hypothetical protein